MRLSPSAISLVLGLVVAGLPALEGCNKPESQAPTPVAKKLGKLGKPVTEDESRAAGEAIANAVDSGDAAALDRMIDWDSMYRRATSGIDAPEKFRNEFMRGLDQARIMGKGLSAVIVDAVKKGGSYTLIHAHTKDDRSRLLFRLLLPDSGMNYHDYSLARGPDGTVKADDVYIYMSGEQLSETLRRPYIQAAAQQNAGLIGRLTGADQVFIKNFQKLGEMTEATRNGRYNDAIRIYRDLPADFRKDKTVLLARLMAAQMLEDDSEYQQSIQDFRAEHPNDASIDILSIDHHFLKKQYQEALDCLDRVDKSVLGDPYLQTMKAGIYLEQNDLDAARAAVKNALDSEPDLIHAYSTLLSISLKEKSHDETLRVLRLIRDNFGVDMGDLSKEPLYKDFVGTPQHQEWVEENREAAPQDAAKEQG